MLGYCLPWCVRLRQRQRLQLPVSIIEMQHMPDQLPMPDQQIAAELPECAKPACLAINFMDPAITVYRRYLARISLNTEIQLPPAGLFPQLARMKIITMPLIE